MNHIYYLILVIFILLGNAFELKGQCPSSALILTTQAEVDDFSTNYPGCSVLNQTLQLDGTGITNLNGLSVLQEIDFFVIRLTAITDFSGLNNLTKVNGNFIVEFNDNLVSFAGIGNLNDVGSLSIRTNQNLVSISSLSNLDFIQSSISISGNSALTSLNGLQGSILVGTGNDFVSINNNDALTSLQDLTDIVAIAGGLSVSFNAALVDIDALYNLTLVEGTCNISYNSQLTSIAGLINVVYCENLNIKENPVLQSLYGLNGLNTILYRLDVSDNLSLVSLAGLVGLSSVETIWIRENGNSFVSLTGLENVTSLKEIWIEKNDGLTSMAGLNGLVAVLENFKIEYNDGLINLVGLENLNDVGNINSISPNFNILGNATLTTLTGLSGLTDLIGNLAIILNPSLLNLSGLENLITANYIAINNNAMLTSLDMLSNLTTITTSLYVNNNNSLLTIMDLTSLNSIPTNIYSFSNNPLLSLCHTFAVCDLITNYPAKINISNNAVGCFDEAEVSTFCQCPVFYLYYPDNDGDGYGDSNSSSTVVCQGTTPPVNHVMNNLDCNDNNPNDINLVVNDNPIIAGLYEGVISLTSNGKVLSISNNVTFHAEVYISLEPGFYVQVGSDFTAEIEGCN